MYAGRYNILHCVFLEVFYVKFKYFGIVDKIHQHLALMKIDPEGFSSPGGNVIALKNYQT